MKFKKTIAMIFSALMLGISVSAEPNAESSYFDLITNYAANLYIDESITQEDLLKAATEKILENNPELMYEMIKSAFGSLDDYSEFYTAEEYSQYFQQLNKIFYGMGVIIQRKDGNVVITRLLENSGAAAAGILVNDILLEVDSQDVSNMILENISAIIAGEEGTFVKIKIRRGDTEMEFDVERKKVEESTVGALTLPGDIGYIEIVSFAEGTSKELSEILADFKEKGIDNIILDLRNNPGGMLSSVIDVARQIVPEGVITQTMYRNEAENATFYSQLKNSTYKFAVLVNENTASAAEVLTGALQDSGAGYVIGKRTYGKGVIQNVFNTHNGDAFKITTGYYLTPNGSNINGIGIEPDEIVYNSKRPIDLSKYETFEYKTRWHKGETSKEILAAKQRLNVLGYYFGDMDEYFNEELETAVYAFQEDKNMYPYGVLDFSTQATLENNFYIIEVEYDDQLYVAYEYLGGNRQDLE